MIWLILSIVGIFALSTAAVVHFCRPHKPRAWNAAGLPLALALLLWPSGCSINPATGKPQFDLAAIPTDVNLLTDLVEQTAYVVLPPKEQDKVVKDAEIARKAFNTEALKNILKNLNNTAGAKAALTPAA